MKRWQSWVLGSLAVLVVISAWGMHARNQAWDQRSMAMVKELLSERKPLPVGRFLVDLPKGAEELAWAQGYIGAGPFIGISDVSLWPDVKKMAEDEMEKWRSQKSVSKVEPGLPLLQLYVESKRVPKTWIWFYWDDDSIARMKGDLATCEGYHWQRGRLFKFKRGAGPYSEWPVNQVKVLREMEDLFASLRVLGRSEEHTSELQSLR